MKKFFLIYLIYHQLFDFSIQDLVKIECIQGQVIPHPTNCKKFIKCGPTDSQNIILECAQSALFNAETGFCDFPQNVNCSTYEFVTREPVILIDLVPSTVEYFYCKPGWLKPHPDDCSKFILCGKKLSEYKVYKCPKSLLYNPYIKGCDIPQNVVCKTYRYEFLTFPSPQNSTTVELSSTSLVSSTKTTSFVTKTTSRAYNQNSTSSTNSSTSPTSSVTSRNSTTLSTTKSFNQTSPYYSETTTNEQTTSNETQETSFSTVQTGLFLTELLTNNSNLTTHFLRETTYVYSNYSNLTTSFILNQTNLFNISDNMSQTTLDFLTTKSSNLSETTSHYNLTLLFNLTTSLNLASKTSSSTHSNSTRFNSFNSTDYSNETSTTYDHQTNTLIETTTNSLNPFSNNYTNLRLNVTLFQTSTSTAELQRQVNCTSRAKNVPNIYFRENGFYLANGTSDTNGQKNIYRKKLTKDYVYENLKYLRSILSPQQFTNQNSNNHHQEDNS